MLTARPGIGRGGDAANEYRLAGREGQYGGGRLNTLQLEQRRALCQRV